MEINKLKHTDEDRRKVRMIEIENAARVRRASVNLLARRLFKRGKSSR